MSKSKTFHKLALSLSSLFLITACGSSRDLGNGYLAAVNSLPPTYHPSASSDDEISTAIPKIIKGLQDIRDEIHAMGGNTLTPIAAPAPASSAAAQPVANSLPDDVPPAATSTANPAAPAPAASATPAAPAGPSAQDEFEHLLNTFRTTPYVDAYVEKTEKNLESGKMTYVKLNMYTKQPNTVKLEILDSSSGISGAKVLYTSGEGNKAKIRPGGAMSFITTDLPKNDDRLTSTNRYLIDNTDLFGVARRLGDGTYKAELVGKTQVAGKTVHVLKVSTTGTNSMDSRIAFEYFGYEPDTYKIRLWEIYAKSDLKTPYERMVLPKIDYPSSLSDDKFKL